MTARSLTRLCAAAKGFGHSNPELRKVLGIYKPLGSQWHPAGGSLQQKNALAFIRASPSCKKSTQFSDYVIAGKKWLDKRPSRHLQTSTKHNADSFQEMDQRIHLSSNMKFVNHGELFDGKLGEMVVDVKCNFKTLAHMIPTGCLW